MKKIIIASTLALFAIGATRAANLTEGFSTGVNASTYSTATSITLPSGEWTMYGVAANTSNGNTAIKYATNNGYIITPQVNNPNSISFKYRSGGSNKDVLVAYTTDGSTWLPLDSFRIGSSSSSFSTFSKTTGLDHLSNVRFRILAKSSNVYVDDAEIMFSSMATEPTTQASISASGQTGSSMLINFSKGNGAGRLLAYQKGTAVTWTPADGESYTGTFPKKLAEDLYIASSNDTTATTISGLLPGETYHFAVFEYNGDGVDRNYLLPAGTCSAQTATEPTLTISTSAINFQKVLVNNSQTRTFSISGKYLTGSSTTIQSDNAAITLSADGSTFAQSISLPVSGGVLSASTITIRFTPTAYQSYMANISISCGATNASLSVAGIGSDTENHEYYIAPNGNDNTGDGSETNPWMNLQKAVNTANPGDVIICRGGRYHFTWRDSSNKLTVRITTSGTSEAPITIRNYEGETPIFDFEQQLLDCSRNTANVGDRGILITGNYWVLYGLHIMHAADNGIKLEGSHNRIERCEFSYNLDTGIQLGFGHNFSDSGYGSSNNGQYCAYNDIIDCDSHHNCDCDANYGSDADGFACKMHNGIGNRFIRCRSWRNSDDAWDLYETDYDVTLIECWAWESGNAEDHLWVKDYFDTSHSFSGNGNGIKLGGNGTGGSSKGVHYAYNCVAFGCDKSGSTKGFDCNSHKGGHVLVGCLAFDNGYDFMFESGGGANSEFYNNVCFGRQEVLVGTESHNAYLGSAEAGQTFINDLVTGFSRSDYESLSEADAIAPRGTDGSMPTKFARLKSGSTLVNAGIDKPVPYTSEFSFLYQPIFGAARDLGPYELREGTNSGNQTITTNQHATNLCIMQGANNGERIARISVEKAAEAQLDIYSCNGQHMGTAYQGHLESGMDYYISLPIGQLPMGVYICSLTAGNYRQNAKMTIVR